MIKKALREKLINKLIEEKKVLTNKVYHNDVDIDGDEIDEIQATLITSISNQLSSRDMQKLHQIEQALSRIEENTFGNCVDCEEPISERRLEINPSCTTCITCAEQREFEDKQRRRS